MNSTVVGLLGLLTIVAIVVTLFKSKTQPAIAFIVFPSILGLVLVLMGRYSFDNLATMTKSGFNSSSVCILCSLLWRNDRRRHVRCNYRQAHEACW